MDDTMFKGLKVFLILLPFAIIALPIAIIVFIVMFLKGGVEYLITGKDPFVEDKPPANYEVFTEYLDSYSSSLPNGYTIKSDSNGEYIYFGSDETGYAVLPSTFTKLKDYYYQGETDDHYVIFTVEGFNKNDKTFEENVDLIKKDLEAFVGEPVADDYSISINQDIYFEVPNFSKDGTANHIAYNADRSDRTGMNCLVDISESSEYIQVLRMYYIRKDDIPNTQSYWDYVSELKTQYPSFGFYHYFPDELFTN